MPERIPDCRLGGGKALVKLAKGGVDGTNKLLVFWNKDDSSGPIREARLSLLDSTYCSVKQNEIVLDYIILFFLLFYLMYRCRY